MYLFIMAEVFFKEIDSFDIIGDDNHNFES